MVKVAKSTGGEEKKDMMHDVRERLNIDHWTVISGKSNPDVQFLISSIDENSLKKTHPFQRVRLRVKESPP